MDTFDYIPEERCQAKCLSNPKCYSFNYKRGSLADRNCKINDGTREMFPDSYRNNAGWVYYNIKGELPF